MTERRARDVELLDALDAQQGESFDGQVWRIAIEGRDPLQGYPAGARWDPGLFDVIYASLAREGALAEIHFHLSRQPVFPSRLTWKIHRISVRTVRTLRLADLTALEALGVRINQFGDLDYRRTQEIGDAAYFLGFDGLIVPSARWACLNIALFTDRFAPEILAVEQSEVVDWTSWRREVASLRKRGAQRLRNSD